MINRVKNIINLSKIFFQNSFQNPYLIDKKTNKINRKSLKVWFLIIIMVTMTYFSYIIVRNLVLIGQANLFLNFMLLFAIIVLTLQVALISTNIYYFSNDLELIMPLPIKPVDILIAKLNTIILNTYFFEIIFVLIPLIIYGIYISAGIVFYIYMIILLLIFPILPALIVSIIMMALMKLSKFIKNKDIFQLIITFLFLIVVVFLLFILIKNIILTNNEPILTEEIEDTKILNNLNNFNVRLKSFNKYFLQINPSIELLNNSNKTISVIYLCEILLIDVISFTFFTFIGKFTYLKNILKNNYFNRVKKIKKIDLENRCKKKNKIFSYINKEFKMLFKNPIFFMQCIYPTLIIIVVLLVILLFLVNNLRNLLNAGELGIGTFELDLNALSIIVGIIQFMLTFSNTSITSVSREGKNATFMKFIPIDYYTQIVCKSIPQIIVNMIFILILSILVYAIFPEINVMYCIYIFLIANLLNFMNSILMVVVDLKDPDLEWNAEYEVVSQSNKKIYQYVFTIIIILFLTYLQKIFSDLNIHVSCIIISLILFLILIIINVIINKNKYKLFKKIN